MSRQRQLAIDALGPRDAAELQSLADRVGWHFTAEQVAWFLGVGSVYGHHREGAAGRALVGASAIYPYGPGLASLGIVMVDPAAQRQGIATQLVRHCLAAVGIETETPSETGAATSALSAASGELPTVRGESRPPEPAVILVATQQGFPVYEALGFRVAEQVQRWEYNGSAAGQDGAGDVAGAPSPRVAPMEVTDLPAAITLDATACGGQRTDVYETLFHMATAGCVHRDEDGAIRGFSLAVLTADRCLIGPVVADDAASAAALVAHLVAKVKTGEMNAARACTPIRIDVLSRQTEFQARLQAMGFRQTRVSPVMLLGAGELPGERGKMFAMIDPALG